MVQPIDYNLNVLSPMQRFTEGLKFGEDLLTARLARDETQQLMDMRAAQEARAVAAEQERRAAAEAQRARAEKMQADLGGLVALAEGGNLTTDAINQFRLNYAETLDDVTNVFTSMEEERQKPLKDFGVKSVTLALTGNAAAAEALYQERIDAAKNAGTPEAMQEARALEADLATLKANPINFATAQATLLRHANYINDEQLKGLLDLAKQGQAAPEGASPLGKTAQDVRSGLIPQSVLDAEIRIAENAGEEGLTLQQRIAEEARLRGEYQKRTEDLSAAERNFSIIETSAADDSGAGDIALVTSFMKMLDPGSVVRETEFATAANAGGLLATLRGFATRIENGKFLDAKQRADFKRLAGDYLNAAKVQEQGVQQGYQRIVDSYGLDPINVFGARAATAPAPAGGTTPAPAGDDAKAAFMANPAVAALAPEVREMAWEIYQKQTGQ